MRWKISHGGHDPRHIDLVATFALLILIVAACRYLSAGSDPPSATAFIVPNLPTPLTTEAVVTVTAAAARGPQIQLTEPPPAPPTTTIPVPPHYATWLKLAQCESGGNWSINTGNGFYGGLQFTITSWRGAGGWQHASRPDLAEPLDQMWAAETLLMMQGWGAWPACARRLGLR